MYEWFERMLGDVNTPRFFVVDGPAQSDLRAAIDANELGLPESYKEFVLRFGDAKLFRQGGTYLVEVFGGPRTIATQDCGKLIQIGRTDLGPSYFDEDRLASGRESPVFEYDSEIGLRQAAEGFDIWLRDKCETARSLYDENTWAQLCAGPVPFSAEELDILEARSQFQWRAIGENSNREILFEVTNRSRRVLPFISIGIRRRNDSSTLGVVWIRTGSVLPGETRVIAKDCYSDHVDPNDIDPFALPDPKAEDREEYWEFRRQ